MKKILAAIILIFTQIVYAQTKTCKMNPKSYDGTYFNPGMANTILIGRIELKKGASSNNPEDYNNSIDFGAVFVSEGTKKLNLQITTGGCGGLINKITDNERYVFISTKHFDQYKEDKSLSFRDGTILRLKDIKDSIFLRYLSRKSLGRDLKDNILEKKEFPAGQSNVLWKYCSSNEDCSTIKDQCGNNVGVNKLFQSKLEDYIKEKKLKCTDKEPSKNQFDSKCVEYFCS